jgi:STAT protein, all-alpha domain
MMTQQFKNDLMHEISEKLKTISMHEDMIFVREDFRVALNKYPFMNSVELFERFSEIFEREMKLLHNYESGNYASCAKGTQDVDRRVEVLKENVCLFQANDFSKWKKTYANYQEESAIVTQNNNNNNSNNNCINANASPSYSIEYNLHMSSLTWITNVMREMQPVMIEKLQQIIIECSEITKIVIENYVAQWKCNQQKCDNNDGADLDKLQAWCSDLGRALFSACDAIKILEENQKFLTFNGNFAEKLFNLRKETVEVLTKLADESIIVDNQPPQVIKTNTRYFNLYRSS